MTSEAIWCTPSKQLRLFAGSFAITCCVLFTGSGCGGTIGSGENVNLGIPYRAQTQFNYCVPASILMWRLYDGLPAISQTTIFNWLGGAPCTANDVPAGVNHFTNTTDAYLDIVFSPTSTEIEELIARQITSYDDASPVITVVYPSRDHVGLINRGKYDNESAGYWTWEFVKFHNPDPSYGANWHYSAGQWLDNFCQAGFSYCAQILSANSITGWGSNRNTFGESIAVYGGGAGCSPSECEPLNPDP